MDHQRTTAAFMTMNPRSFCFNEQGTGKTASAIWAADFHQDLLPQLQKHCWDCHNARKAKGESIRIFPISNWTELDIWNYILLNDVPVNPLYFAKERPIVWRGEQLIMVDDERYPLRDGEKPEMRKIRFRTLGCYPLTAGVESNAVTLEEVVEEVIGVKLSERATRLIDGDNEDSMEKKKREGYF